MKIKSQSRFTPKSAFNNLQALTQ